MTCICWSKDTQTIFAGSIWMDCMLLTVLVNFDADVRAAVRLGEDALISGCFFA